VGAQLFNADRRVDGQTDMTKIIVAFRNSANSPKTIVLFLQTYMLVKIFFLIPYFISLGCLELETSPLLSFYLQMTTKNTVDTCKFPQTDLKTRKYASCDPRGGWSVLYCSHSCYFRLCLCNPYIQTRLPKYLIVLYLDCIVNICITLQDSQNLHPSPRRRKILTHCYLRAIGLYRR